MRDPTKIRLFHIVHVERLELILRDGHLLSDRFLQDRPGPAGDPGIGHDHIKQRRLTEKRSVSEWSEWRSDGAEA